VDLKAVVSLPGGSIVQRSVAIDVPNVAGVEVPQPDREHSSGLVRRQMRDERMHAHARGSNGRVAVGPGLCVVGRTVGTDVEYERALRLVVPEAVNVPRVVRGNRSTNRLQRLEIVDPFLGVQPGYAVVVRFVQVHLTGRPGDVDVSAAVRRDRRPRAGGVADTEPINLGVLRVPGSPKVARRIEVKVAGFHPGAVDAP